jgi:hypothetical protein
MVITPPRRHRRQRTLMVPTGISRCYIDAVEYPTYSFLVHMVAYETLLYRVCTDISILGSYGNYKKE